MEFIEAAAKAFTLDEGERNKPYRDSKGYWTIGRGHLIGESLEDLELSPHIINEIFKEDLEKAVYDAKQAVGPLFYNALTDARKIALVSMLFTLGRAKFQLFRETLAAMKRYDWYSVSNLILHTKWARDVDPLQRKEVGRDDRIAYMFREGTFHPEYKI